MKQILEKAELALMGLLIISIVLEMMGSPVPSLFIISMTGLAIVFLVNAQIPADQSDQKQHQLMDLILPKVLWISTSVAVIGVMFEAQHFEGSLNMLLIGGGGITICAAIAAVLRLAANVNMQSLIPVLYRAFPALIAAAYLAFPLLA